VLIVEFVQRAIAEKINEELVPDLVDLNFAVEERPEFRFLPMSDDTQTDLLKVWGELVGIGAVTSTFDDEAHIRALTKFPEREEPDEEELLEPLLDELEDAEAEADDDEDDEEEGDDGEESEDDDENETENVQRRRQQLAGGRPVPDGRAALRGRLQREWHAAAAARSRSVVAEGAARGSRSGSQGSGALQKNSRR